MCYSVAYALPTLFRFCERLSSLPRMEFEENRKHSVEFVSLFLQEFINSNRFKFSSQFIYCIHVRLNKSIEIKKAIRVTWYNVPLTEAYQSYVMVIFSIGSFYYYHLFVIILRANYMQLQTQLTFLSSDRCNKYQTRTKKQKSLTLDWLIQLKTAFGSSRIGSRVNEGQEHRARNPNTI